MQHLKMKRKITENCILTKPVYEENENKNISANVKSPLKNQPFNSTVSKTILKKTLQHKLNTF